MDTAQAIVLALIQGVTEFLPVSSSAHLILPFQFLGWQDQGLAFDVAVHLGSLLAVIGFLRHEIAQILSGLWKSMQTGILLADARLGLLVLVASLPIIPAGWLLKSAVETELRNVTIIAAATIIFAILLGVADRTRNPCRPLMAMGWGSALVIGVAQCFALVPGTSRSGVTITMALLLGLGRSDAARFSFLLSIPAILGATVLKSIDLVVSPVETDWGLLAIAIVTAALSAYASLYAFLSTINRISLMPFVIYRLLLGGALLLLV